jgi:pimeloyl-ACP methyl ester carboxylesterase
MVRRRARTPTASGAYLQSLIAVTRRLPDLATIKIPVLALLSAGSTFSDPVLTRELLTAMAACTIVTLDARHWIPTEQPEAMREIVLTPRIRPRASLWQAGSWGARVRAVLRR